MGASGMLIKVMLVLLAEGPQLVVSGKAFITSGELFPRLLQTNCVMDAIAYAIRLKHNPFSDN